MKGIFIKNMEMPKFCYECPVLGEDLEKCRVTKKPMPLNGRPDWCPLEEITECNDAPKREIVKCGDCIYYSSIDMLCIRPTEVAGVFMLENEWCRYGKRRTS